MKVDGSTICISGSIGKAVESLENGRFIGSRKSSRDGEFRDGRKVF